MIWVDATVSSFSKNKVSMSIIFDKIGTIHFNRHDLILRRIKFHSSVPVENNYLSIVFNIQLYLIVIELIHFWNFLSFGIVLKGDFIHHWNCNIASIRLIASIRHSAVPLENKKLQIIFNIQLFSIVTELIHFVTFSQLWILF